jgi:hypothetical protein
MFQVPRTLGRQLISPKAQKLSSQSCDAQNTDARTHPWKGRIVGRIPESRISPTQCRVFTPVALDFDSLSAVESGAGTDASGS